MKVYVIAKHPDTAHEVFLVKSNPYTFDADWTEDNLAARKFSNRRNAGISWVGIKKMYPDDELSIQEVEI